MYTHGLTDQTLGGGNRLDPFILSLPSELLWDSFMSQKLSKLMNIIILGTAVCALVCADVASVDKHHQEVCCYLSSDGASAKWLPEHKVLGQLPEKQSRGVQVAYSFSLLLNLL